MKLNWHTGVGANWVRFVILVLLLGQVLACKERNPEADPQIYIGAGEMGLQSFPNNCDIISYYVLPNKIGNVVLEEAADAAFSIWTKGFPRLMFQSIELSSKAKIRIEVKPYNIYTFGNADGGDSTITNYILQAKTTLEKTVDGAFVIYIDNTYSWTRDMLTRALSYQIGRVLGLFKSNIENDIMYPYMYANRNEDSRWKLSPNDIQQITNIYPKPCSANNRWVIRRSILPPFFNETNKYSVPVTFSLPESDTLYVLWPDRIQNEWKLHKILFDKQNPQKDSSYQEIPLKIQNISSETIQPAGIYAFTVGTRAFVGSSQWFTNPKQFFEYSSKTGTFTTLPISLSAKREVYSVALGGPNNKGYVLMVNQDNPNLSSIAIFDPNRSSNNWISNLTPPEPIYTATTIFPTTDNRVCLYNGFAAYFLNNANQWSKISFNITDPNQFKEPRNTIVGANELSLKMFTIGNRTFLLRDNYGVERNRLGAGVDNEVLPEDLWEVNQSFQFTNRASLPAQGIVLAVIGHKGKGYVFTSKGRIYEYTP